MRPTPTVGDHASPAMAKRLGSCAADGFGPRVVTYGESISSTGAHMMTEPPVSPFSRSDESGAVAAADAALERHRTDPTHLLQILIETQDRLA